MWIGIFGFCVYCADMYQTVNINLFSLLFNDKQTKQKFIILKLQLSDSHAFQGKFQLIHDH